MLELPFQVADLAQRIIAKLIDLVLAMIVGAALFSVVGLETTADYVIGGLWIVLFLIADGFKGQSLGKRVLNIQVIARKSLKPCGPTRSIVRNIFLIELVFWVFALVDWLLVYLFDRRVGDLVAGTYVIKLKNDAAQSDQPN